MLIENTQWASEVLSKFNLNKKLIKFLRCMFCQFSYIFTYFYKCFIIQRNYKNSTLVCIIFLLLSHLWCCKAFPWHSRMYVDFNINLIDKHNPAKQTKLVTSSIYNQQINTAYKLGGYRTAHDVRPEQKTEIRLGSIEAVL